MSCPFFLAIRDDAMTDSISDSISESEAVIPAADTCVNPCNKAPCRSVFDRVHVSHLIRGGTRVMWDLMPEFTDPPPHTFQLQVGRTGNTDADDWEDVGLPVVDSFYAIDGEQRAWGQIQQTHYRVTLTTTLGTYYSDPTGGLGILSHRAWREAREIIRKERVRFRETQEGYLLKRRISGAKCTLCLEHQTDEPCNPECPECYGTGFQCGYFYPMPCVWADISPKTHRTGLDPQRGTTNIITVPARMLMVPLLDSYDVWVSKKTDDRYYIHSIQVVAEWHGVPLIANVELRPAPFTDVIYSIEIPDQVAAIS